MGKKNLKKKVNNKSISNKKKVDDDLEFLDSIKVEAKSNKKTISILTVSQIKRIPFLHNLSRMIEYQNDCDILEWVITNGSNNDEDFEKFNEEIKKVTCKVPIKIVYKKDLEYRNIGAFRNLANSKASGDIIICMDDDDFYFKDYIKTCYNILTTRKDIETVGCSGMLMYDYGFDTIFRIAQFGPNHTVNCCLAYRREYFNNHKYDETRETGEEMSFLDQYKSKMFQLPPTSGIIHMSYADNTFSGKRLNMLNAMYANSVIKDGSRPNIYNPINSSLETLINNNEIFECYIENFKRINYHKETDVVFYYGNQGREWDPNDDNLYSYERKCLEVGKSLVAKGYSVSIYGKFNFNELEKDGLLFYNLKYFNVRRKTKYLIVMDFYGFVPVFNNEKIVEKINAEKIFIDVQSNLYIYFEYITPKLANKVLFGMKNIFHIQMNPPGSTENLKAKPNDIILPNGINLELFQKDYDIKREPKRFCYTSRLQNGLLELLKYDWPLIIEKHPEAEFHIYYGYENSNEDLLKEIKELLLQDGVHYHGRVSHEEIAKEFRRSSFLFYYTGTPGETDALSVMEASASGCIPIIWNKNIFSRLQGLVVEKAPMEVKSHTELAEKLCTLLSQDDQREKASEQLKKSPSIIDVESCVEILIDAFKGDYVTLDGLQRVHQERTAQNNQQSESKPVESINLQNYVDSDSDVEYEKDSDEEIEFIESSDFNGSKPGYIYKNGDKGLGYYQDTKNKISKKEVETNFIPSTDFNGSKPGYIYKNGDSGLGYYKD